MSGKLMVQLVGSEDDKWDQKIKGNAKIATRLIGAEDIRWDVDGTGEAGTFVDYLGQKHPITGISSDVVPCGAKVRERLGLETGTVSEALEALSASPRAVSELGEDTQVVFVPSETLAEKQKRIDEQPRNLGGHELRFNFTEAIDVNVVKPLSFSGFYNGHLVIDLCGVSISEVSRLEELILLSGCFCKVEIRNGTFDFATSVSAVRAKHCPAVYLTDLVFKGGGSNAGYSGESSDGYASGCTAVKCKLLFSEGILEEASETRAKELVEAHNTSGDVHAGVLAKAQHTHALADVPEFSNTVEKKISAHNASDDAHANLFQGKISCPTEGSAGQYLKLMEEGVVWADVNADIDVSGKIQAHNASGVAHWQLFRAKISKPETGSAGQYLKLNPDGTCSWADVAAVPIGMIFPFASNVPPAGAYLLNGQTISSCQTLYPQFWEWVCAEATAGRLRTVEDNAAYDAELSAKGNCGAFVLNAGGVSGAVRLPSVEYGFVMGAPGPQIGQTLAAGLPNITGSFGAKQFTAYGDGWGEGAFYAENPSGDSAGGGSSGKTTVFYLDASRSSSVYGNSSTVQPASVRFVYCIQVYHATSSLSEQQAVQLSAEMQLKADTSLSNLTDNGIRAVRGVFSSQPSGYAWLPSGMIIQWGETAAQNEEVSADVIFPATFPNACLTVVVGTKIEESVTVPSGCDFTVQLVSKTLTGATFFWQNNSGQKQKAKATWIAIGY